MKSEVLLFTVLLALIQSSGGLLLDGPTIGGKQTTGNTQFLTETEFLQAKQVLKQDTNNLRHDMDKTFALMTSQLKSKFDLLETKLAEVDNRNKTNNDCISMEEYVALEQKLSNVEQKLANVEQKLTNAQRKNDQMEQENAAVKNELFSLKNNSSKQNIKIEELQKLVTIKPLQEFSALQQSVHQNADKIQFLTMNEQARGQDFLALYNITITTGRKLAEMKASTNNLILELKHNQTMEMNHMKQTLDKQLTNLQTSYNATINEFETKEIYLLQQSVHLNEDKLHSLILNEQARGQDVLALYNITTATGRKLTEMKTSTSNLFLEMKNNQTMEINDLKQDFDNQLASFQTSYNATINDLHTKEISMQKQITENNERVALFAWASDKNYRNVIRFNNVQLSVGITNISAFKSTGKFVCEKEGLYLVAVSVVSKDSYSSFCVYHRGMVSCTEIGQHFGVAGHSGTSVATLHLQVNDNVRVETSYTIEASYWTQFTLIKIK